MKNPIAALLLFAGAAAAAGCNGPHPFVQQGDADSVEILYAGDVASAWPVARAHCAQYERTPQLVDAGLDVAVFHCIAR